MLTYPLLAKPNYLDFLGNYPGANVGLSLRRLSGSYSDSIIKVRRSSDNDELNIGLSGNELDTELLLNFCGSGNGFITEWYSQVRNILAYQYTTTNQPLIVSNGTLIRQNNRASISFNGSQFLLVNHSPLISSNADFGWLVVGRVSGSPQTLLVKALDPVTANTEFLLDRDSLNVRFVVLTESTPRIANRNSTALTLSIINGIKIGDNIRVSVNNVGSQSPITLPSTINVNTGNLRIGDRFGTRRLIGNISEIIYYQSNILDDISSMNNAINTYYALY